MMKKKVNVAIQVLPQSAAYAGYTLVDVAIEEIKKWGLKYKVCPFETVVEGDYDEIMQMVKRIHEVVYEHGAEKMLTYLKIQSSGVEDVTIEDKMHKYE